MLEQSIKNIEKIDEHTQVAVIGTGASGRAAIQLLHKIGARIRVLEQNINSISPDFLAFLKSANIELIDGEHKKQDFENIDLIIPSPGVSVQSFLHLLPTKLPAIISEIELASRFVDEDMIAITGTSGKTTTTSLIEAMLKEHGLKTFVGGNIGTPLASYVVERMNNMREKADVIVLELSSFQLQTSHTLKPKVALLLNISENHLDYHKDMKEYIDAKMRLFAHQSSDDIALFNKDLESFSEQFAINGTKEYFQIFDSSRFSKSQLFGAHNILNAEAAFCATKHFNVSLEEAQKALAQFKAIEHRLEKVSEINSILFINDSKGTTAESLKIALQSFERPILLLVGGKFKGGDLVGLIPLIQEKVRKVMVFGGSRSYFEEAWKNIVEMDYSENLNLAVRTLFAQAQKDDVILLSPATSSFDQYQSYIKRGEDFKNIVFTLQTEIKE